ncbi:MAG: hypothetical protein ASARMPRED_001263 [Alectoria sarmentosa]|nr:MAG: hypothetical protein ASARMPRED_001263 [Alectoria sarmentosa]
MKSMAHPITSSNVFAFPADVQRAYQAGLYADLKITCGKSEFMVHKIIVCSQSKVFQAKCLNGFIQQESSIDTIDLTADGISLVSRMIHCLYYGTYEDFHKGDDAGDWRSAHQLHAAVYALGDKYDLVELKNIALANFNKLATPDPRGLIESIPIVYSSTPDSDRSLRNAILEKIKVCPSRFLHEDVKASFQKVLLEVPDFSWDLHQYWMSVAPEPTGPASENNIPVRMRAGHPSVDRGYTPKSKAENSFLFERSTSLWSHGTFLSLKDGMQKVMKSGEYSDLTILCEDQTFSVHKVVVCSQSKVLAAAMKKGFKLYTGNYAPNADMLHISDAPTGEVREYLIRKMLDTPRTRISGRDPSPPSPAPKAKDPPDYSMHVEMYALSDLYDIPALGMLAKAKLEVASTVDWHPSSFLEIVPRVYESTLESNQGLRTIVLDGIRKHSNDFMKDELLKASFQSLLAATPELGTALLIYYMTVAPCSPEGDLICPNCGPAAATVVPDDALVSFWPELR